jgi:hypothetical protein
MTGSNLIRTYETARGDKRRELSLPFGLAITWGSSEFETFSVWIGTQNGGFFFGKDHS